MTEAFCIEMKSTYTGPRLILHSKEIGDEVGPVVSVEVLNADLALRNK